jgi:hypothetical protein
LTAFCLGRTIIALHGTPQTRGCHIEAYRLAGLNLGEPDHIRQYDLLFPEVLLRADPLMFELSPCVRSVNEPHERVARESQVTTNL